MARYVHPSEHAKGAPLTYMKKVLAKQLGVEHQLAAGLWATGVYMVRIVASMAVGKQLAASPQPSARWFGKEALRRPETTTKV